MKKLLKIVAIIFIAFFVLGLIGMLLPENENVEKSIKAGLDLDKVYNDALTAIDSNDLDLSLKKIDYLKENNFDSLKIENLKTEYNKLKSNKLEKLNIEINKLKKFFRVRTDEFQKITWYTPKHVSQYYSNNVYVYFGLKNNKLTEPRVVISYTGDDWLFWNEVQFLIDGSDYNYYPRNKPNRDNDGGDVFEKSDEVLSNIFLQKIYRMNEAKVVKYRLKGEYIKDFTLSRKKIDYLKRSVDLYKLMKEKQTLGLK